MHQCHIFNDATFAFKVCELCFKRYSQSSENGDPLSDSNQNHSDVEDEVDEDKLLSL
jgi:hypothetical protein